MKPTRSGELELYTPLGCPWAVLWGSVLSSVLPRVAVCVGDHVGDSVSVGPARQASAVRQQAYAYVCTFRSRILPRAPPDGARHAWDLEQPLAQSARPSVVIEMAAAL